MSNINHRTLLGFGNHWRIVSGFVCAFLCACLFAQTGCSWRRGCANCGYHPGSAAVGVGYSVATAERVDGTSATPQTRTDAPPVYNYPDGIAVGRQFARNNRITQTLDSQRPLPPELRDTGFGAAFEAGCREGINQEARDQARLASLRPEHSHRDAAANHARSAAPTSSQLTADCPDLDLQIPEDSPQQHSGSRDMWLNKSDFALSAEADAADKSMNKDLVANRLITADKKSSLPADTSLSDPTPEVEQWFANSQELTPAEPQVEAAPLRSALMDPQQAQELASSLAATEGVTTEQLPPNPPQTPYAQPANGGGSFAVAAEARNQSSELNRQLPVGSSNVSSPGTSAMIVLRAKPVPFQPTASEPQTVGAQAANQATQTAAEIACANRRSELHTQTGLTGNRIPAGEKVIKLIAKPEIHATASPQRAQNPTAPGIIRPAGPQPVPNSVLVDRLDGVAAQLVPLPTLKARTDPDSQRNSQKSTSQKSTTQARYRFPPN